MFLKWSSLRWEHLPGEPEVGWVQISQVILWSTLIFNYDNHPIILSRVRTRSWLGANFPGQARLQGVMHCNGDHWRRRRLFYALPSHLSSAASSASASSSSASSQQSRGVVEMLPSAAPSLLATHLPSDPTRLAQYVYMTNHCTSILGPRTYLRAWILVSEDRLCMRRKGKSHIVLN